MISCVLSSGEIRVENGKERGRLEAASVQSEQISPSWVLESRADAAWSPEGSLGSQLCGESEVCIHPAVSVTVLCQRWEANSFCLQLTGSVAGLSNS